MTYDEYIFSISKKMAENRVNYTSIDKPEVLLVDVENARTAVECVVNAVKKAMLKDEPDPANQSTINKLLFYLRDQNLIPDWGEESHEKRT